MLDHILSLDRELFLWLNGMHTVWLDKVMFVMTNFLVWLPLFIIIFYLLIRIYRIGIITILAAVTILITGSDQLSGLVKSDVQRLRPANDPTISAGVHIVNGYKGGRFGYYSAHASNTFALAVFLCLLFRKRFRYLPAILFAWASLMSYTRIYLGLHYPLDILSGMLIGSVLGWFIGRVTIYLLSLQGVGPAVSRTTHETSSASK